MCTLWVRAGQVLLAVIVVVVLLPRDRIGEG